MEKIAERKLLHQDDALLEKILTDKSKFIPLLNSVKEAYENLEIGDFTEEIWNEIKANGATKISERYHKALDDDMSRTGVKNKVLRAVVLNGTNEVIDALKIAIDTIYSFEPKLYSDRTIKLTYRDISFVDGQFEVTEKDKESILENYCRCYLNPGVATEFYDLMVVAQLAYKELAKFDEKLGLGLTVGRSFNIFDPFFQNIGPDVEINGYAVNDVETIGARRKKYGY